MLNEYEEIIINLKEKIFQLITLHEQLKEENQKKIVECNNLKEEMLNKQNLIIELEKKADILKFSKTIGTTDEDTHKTKLHINKIVREIDKCIALLNN